MPLQVKEKYKTLPTLKREHVIKLGGKKTEFKAIRKTKLNSEMETYLVKNKHLSLYFFLRISQLLSGMCGNSSISSMMRKGSSVYFQSAALVTLVTVFLWSSLTKTLHWQLFSLFKWESVEKGKNLEEVTKNMCHCQAQNLVTIVHQIKSNSINNKWEGINKAKIELTHTLHNLKSIIHF